MQYDPLIVSYVRRVPEFDRQTWRAVSSLDQMPVWWFRVVAASMAHLQWLLLRSDLRSKTKASVGDIASFMAVLERAGRTPNARLSVARGLQALELRHTYPERARKAYDQLVGHIVPFESLS